MTFIPGIIVVGVYLNYDGICHCCRFYKFKETDNGRIMYHKAFWRNHCCSGKAIRIIHSECVSVALGIQHAVPMRNIILPSVACLAVPRVSTFSKKRHDFQKTIMEHKTCASIFSTIYF